MRSNQTETSHFPLQTVAYLHLRYLSALYILGFIYPPPLKGHTSSGIVGKNWKIQPIVYIKMELLQQCKIRSILVM